MERARRFMIAPKAELLAHCINSYKTPVSDDDVFFPGLVIPSVSHMLVVSC